jgi:uncharacterized protein YukE
MFYDINIVQMDDEKMETIAQTFDEQAQKVLAHRNKVVEQVYLLFGYGDDSAAAWLGPNAEVFYSRMINEVELGLNRLIMTLEESAKVTRQVQKIIRDADEQNKAYFPN